MVSNSLLVKNTNKGGGHAVIAMAIGNFQLPAIKTHGSIDDKSIFYFECIIDLRILKINLNRDQNLK